MNSNYGKIKDENLFFEEPSLEMPTAGRLLSRLISYSAYAVATAGAITLLMSDVKWLFWLGILLAAFLLDRLFHANKPRRKFYGLKIKKGDQINIALYFEPKGIIIMEKARDKALLSGKSFYLYLLLFLSKNSDIKEGLKRLDVSFDDFIQKADSLMAKDEKKEIADKKTVKAQIERIGKISFNLALANGKNFVEPIDIFGALAFVNDEKINRIFNLFSIHGNLGFAVRKKPFNLFTFS